MKKRPLALCATLLCLVFQPLFAKSGSIEKIGAQAFSYPPTASFDNLWDVSRQVLPAQGVTHYQVMLSLLRNNPDAFVKGNIFCLRQGIVLTIPALSEVQAEEVAKASALYAEHQNIWASYTGRSCATYPPSPEIPPLAQTAPPAEAVSSTGATAPVAVTPPVTSRAVVPPIVEKKTPQITSETSGGADSTGGRWFLWLAIATLSIFALLFWARKSKPRAQPDDKPKRLDATPPATQALAQPPGLQENTLVSRIGETDRAVKQAAKDPMEAKIKLAMGQAYLELNQKPAARQVLNEVIQEGSADLRQQAEKLLSREL
jgi:FimV-like protein